jgi:hypothetical protein
MNKLPLLPILRALCEGRTIRKIATLIMQAFAVAFLLIGLYAVVTLIRGMSGAPTEGIIVSIIALILLPAMCVVAAQIFWLRSGNVQDLPETPYTLLPIASIFMRAGGETAAAVYATFGLLGCLFQWIAKANPLEAFAPSFIPAIPDQNPFLAGLLFLLRCSLGAGVALLIGYFLAETILYFVDLLVHTRMIAGQSPTAPSPLVGVPTFPAPAPAPQQYPAPMPQYPGAAPQYPGPTPYDPAAPQYPASPQYPGAAPQYPPQYPPATPQYGAPAPQYGAPTPQYGATQPPTAPAIPKCPVCGTDVTPGAPFCGRCGNPLPGRPPGY